MVWKACRKFRYKNNRTTAAIGVILAFTGERCFISTENQRCLRRIQKPAAALVKAYIYQVLTILSKSISCDSPFKGGFVKKMFRVVGGFCLIHCNENPIYVFLFWELRGLSPNLHIYVCERLIYLMIVNRSQTHECGNRDCGREIPFLGIFVSKFRYWFFAV